MTVRAVLFDIGNVLIEWQPVRFFDRVIGVDRRVAFFAGAPILNMNERVDAGENFQDSVAEMIAAHSDWTDELALWRDRWIEMPSPVIDHAVRLLRALRRARRPVFALSNFGNETFEIAVCNYPFLDEFDRRFISAELGMSKPKIYIYQRVEDECGIQQDALLFTDDRPENIAAAQERGWRTHLFDGPDGWAARLVREGLLTTEAAV
ncbi:putative HAD-superfamily hydrolase [Octadecabacter antarcticus 307]|uniref:Putative HAD-superfamily hydrolase n=1 Tax=Octadecabacter antarcticus 307 TaxID=391626 RepID=M9R8Z0_9RHOB|nr:HAD-IA family hydrolase [Octadecabacter antarcticus]AGI66225.1 putative HAD-superfamily hydrolase [Octadecabacter antarcticus 307]